jgi:hypothetical protein
MLSVRNEAAAYSSLVALLSRKEEILAETSTTVREQLCREGELPEMSERRAIALLIVEDEREVLRSAAELLQRCLQLLLADPTTYAPPDASV